MLSLDPGLFYVINEMTKWRFGENFVLRNYFRQLNKYRHVFDKFYCVLTWDKRLGTSKKTISETEHNNRVPIINKISPTLILS